MAKEKVLVIEDDEDIQDLVTFNLSKSGYNAFAAGSGEAGLKAARAEQPDLVVLDLMLPGIDGMEVCRLLRADPALANVAIIMLTARSEETDIVHGLEMGADDYLPKPFSPRVLVARVRAALRKRKREQPSDEETIRVRNYVINPSRHEVAVSGQAVDLTVTEFALLYFLARRPGWVFTRDQIIDAIKGENYAVTSRAVDVQIVGLRKKLGPAGKDIETVRGVGYRFRE